MPLQQTSGNDTSDAYAGGAAVVPNYIEDVFSTYLYTGNATSQTIINGIDLSAKGGLVWTKSRGGAEGGFNHIWLDTVRGGNLFISSNNNVGSRDDNRLITSFNTNGYSFGTGSNTQINYLDSTYVSWTFRKQPKFFDVVTYTGTGSNKTINHNLGSAPGCIIIKDTSNAYDWIVYHKSLATGEYLVLNSTAAKVNTSGDNVIWNVTSTSFNVASSYGLSYSGDQYVAYVFADNAGGFGAAGTDNVITCGSFTADGSGNANITLGYEPQWVLIKNITTTDSWYLTDTMRGMPVTPITTGPFLSPNTSTAEGSWGSVNGVNATGWNTTGLLAGRTYIYIAIRRGPMKTPTTGTSVFAPQTWAGNTTNQNDTRSINGIGSPTDLFIGGDIDNPYNHNYTYDRLRGTNATGGLLLKTHLAYSESTNNPTYGTYSFAQQDGITLGSYDLNYTGRNYIGWFFKRAPGFFDEVCYTGNSTSGTTIAHNLGVAPELIIVKERTASRNWIVGNTSIGWTQYIQLNSAGTPTALSGIWNDTPPTSSVFTVGSSVATNDSGQTYVAYLFATVAGVSKVGSYTGTGSSQVINCGFTSGARFVIIKRTDSTGDWYVYDTTRGMVSGTDPYLLLNTVDSQVNSNYVYTSSTGFTITSAAPAAINASGGTYAFLAIA